MPTDPQLQAALDVQLGHCQKLLQSVTDAVQRWKENGGQAFENVADELVQTIFARSTRTYEAVVEHLGSRGFAEQGAMLNRSLFEDMVDARWVTLNADLAAVERLRQHDRYSHALRLDVAKRFPEYTQGALKELDPPMSDDERNQSKDLFGRYGDGSWTGVSLYDRFKAIESTWAEGLARRQGDFMRAWVHRLNNETLHLSAYSLARLGSPKLVGDALHFRLGSTEEFLTHTLWCAFWTYTQTACSCSSASVCTLWTTSTRVWWSPPSRSSPRRHGQRRHLASRRLRTGRAGGSVAAARVNPPEPPADFAARMSSSVARRRRHRRAHQALPCCLPRPTGSVHVTGAVSSPRCAGQRREG